MRSGGVPLSLVVGVLVALIAGSVLAQVAFWLPAMLVLLAGIGWPVVTQVIAVAGSPQATRTRAPEFDDHVDADGDGSDPDSTQPVRIDLDRADESAVAV